MIWFVFVIASALADLVVDLMINDYGSTGLLPGVGNPKFLTKSEMSGTWKKNGVQTKIDVKTLVMVSFRLFEVRGAPLLR